MTMLSESLAEALFNRTHARVGHVFQGRFKAILVHKDSYLLELARYVMLNPLRAKRVRRPARWRWCSYPATCGQAAKPDWLQVASVLAQFATQHARAIEHYVAFVPGNVIRDAGEHRT